MYSKTVMDHFKHPRNVGVIDNADGLGELGNPLCGDMMSVYLKIQDDRIDDIKFQTFGCGAAIAVSSMLTEMAKGKSLEDAKKISNKDVAEALEGIKDYEDKRDGKVKAEPKRKEDATPSHGGDTCYCPYCDTKIDEGVSFCMACQSDLEEHH
ncbi:MAG: iron-sulfur cluster assembly scaffold protein [Deltaproteobacteria bacterium]|nr:iron-sulfur cluster assembly scaffold protein [Deltaproteobacteria bacterium]